MTTRTVLQSRVTEKLFKRRSKKSQGFQRGNIQARINDDRLEARTRYKIIAPFKLKVMLHQCTRDDSQRNVMFVVDHYQVVYCSSILLTAKLKILTRRGIIFYMLCLLLTVGLIVHNLKLMIMINT